MVMVFAVTFIMNFLGDNDKGTTDTPAQLEKGLRPLILPSMLPELTYPAGGRAQDQEHSEKNAITTSCSTSQPRKT